jgi:hypothetical protein
MTNTTRKGYVSRSFQTTQTSDRVKRSPETETQAENHENGSWQSHYAGRQYAPYGNSIAQFERYRKEH